jgi:hypothetical protein
MSFRVLQESLHAKKLPFLNEWKDFNNRLMLITFFNAFKSYRDQSYPCTWKFPGISYFSDLRQTRCARKIEKLVLETTLIKPKKPRIIWFMGNIFSIFLESLN